MTQPTKPISECKHRPTSNGWSSGGQSGPYTHCGHCKAWVLVDEDWANLYYDKALARMQAQIDSGWAPARTLIPLQEDRVHLLGLIRADRAHRVPVGVAS